MKRWPNLSAVSHGRLQGAGSRVARVRVLHQPRPFSSWFLPLREQEHYVYEVFNLLSVKRLELNAGVGEGLTAGSNASSSRWMILGYTWDKDEARAPLASMRPLR